MLHAIVLSMVGRTDALLFCCAGQRRLLHAIVRLGGFNQVAAALQLRCDATAGRQRAEQPCQQAGAHGAKSSSIMLGRAGGRSGRVKALPRAQSAPAGRAELVQRVADQVSGRP